MLLADRHKERVKREDRRAGEVVAILYNINRDSEKDPRGMDWQDVFAEWKEERFEDEDEMFAAMKLFAQSTEGLSH